MGNIKTNPQTRVLSETGLPGDEDAAKDYLIGAGILRVPSRCPACGGRDIRPIRRNQFRCRGCKDEWSIRQGSILDGLRISFSNFLLLVRSFGDDIPASEAARCLGLSYNTVYEVYHRLRTVIPAADEPRAAVSGSVILAQGALNQQVVFGIRQVDSRIVITQVTSPDPGIITALPIPTMQRGNILFIDAYGKKYQGFITYIPDRNGKELIRIRARDGMPWSPLGSFWDFASAIWASHKGLHREQIPAFVQELAFRYNYRGSDLFPEMLERIALQYP